MEVEQDQELNIFYLYELPPEFYNIEVLVIVGFPQQSLWSP